MTPNQKTDDVGDCCYCCGEKDDPDGDGPAINTGFCHECTDGGCRERQVGTPCQKVEP